jgi:hypothetical protein
VDARRFPERLPRDVVALLGAALAWLTWLQVQGTRWGVDSHAYWAAWQGAMYDRSPDTLDAYLYSPAFAEAVWPLTRLPWPVFGWLWALAVVTALVVLLKPLGWPWVFALLLCCTPEIVSGNVFWLLALVAAYGLRWPALWAFALLTKLTPGIGLLWFAVRREWRPLLVAAAATALVAAVSVALDAGLWRDWFSMLQANASRTSGSVGSDLMPPLLYRLPVGLALVVWGGLTDRRWTIPAAMVLVTPVASIATFTMLAALPRLQSRSAADPPRTLTIDRRRHGRIAAAVRGRS